MELKTVRGTRDILPEETKKLRFIENCCREVVEKHGFCEIVLPTFEKIDLYQRSVGETSDIVEKQMYEIVDSKERKFVLRPEGTAGLIRCYLENNLKDKYPLKRFFYFGSMFRYERPQKGRYREFFQFGFEIINETAPASDFFTLKIINEIFNRVNIKAEVFVNSVGCERCREKYRAELIKYLNNESKKLCEDCQKRLVRNPLRILDCKIDNKKIVDVPKIKNYLCEICNNNYSETKKLLKELNIDFVEDDTLVRGLDYYTGFVFEHKVRSLESAQDTVCAGGRYDNLIKQFGGEDTPACGCAFGIDRMMDLVKEPTGTEQKIVKIGIAVVNDEYVSKGFEINNYLTTQCSMFNVQCSMSNIIVIGPFNKKSLKSQLRLFNNENCNYVIIVGEEINKGEVVIKDFVTNTQKTLKKEELLNYIK